MKDLPKIPMIEVIETGVIYGYHECIIYNKNGIREFAIKNKLYTEHQVRFVELEPEAYTLSFEEVQKIRQLKINKREDLIREFHNTYESPYKKINLCELRNSFLENYSIENGYNTTVPNITIFHNAEDKYTELIEEDINTEVNDKELDPYVSTQDLIDYLKDKKHRKEELEKRLSVLDTDEDLKIY